jgi:glycosyltransferase involved in cell wall biosynthesis
MLRADGYATRKILIGMDLARFYPRDVPRSRPVLLAMARPRTPRRGFDAVIAALEKVKQARPEVDIVLFGDSDLKRYPISFDYRDEGVIADQDRMAEVYSEADVFLDGSEFQGFGRCGLEAMACGAACVLTSVGGVNEYARHAENALLVAPAQPDAFADAMVLLLENEQLRARLVAAGLNTVKRFCHRREAGETLGYFQSLLNRETEK